MYTRSSCCQVSFSKFHGWLKMCLSQPSADKSSPANPNRIRNSPQVLPAYHERFTVGETCADTESPGRIHNHPRPQQGGNTVHRVKLNFSPLFHCVHIPWSETPNWIKGHGHSAPTEGKGTETGRDNLDLSNMKCKCWFPLQNISKCALINMTRAGICLNSKTCPLYKLPMKLYLKNK